MRGGKERWGEDMKRAIGVCLCDAQGRQTDHLILTVSWDGAALRTVSLRRLTTCSPNQGDVDLHRGRTMTVDFAAPRGLALSHGAPLTWCESIPVHVSSESACHDCGAMPGAPHVPGCDMERCPKCGGQAISCGCVSAVDDTDGR